MVRRVSDQDIQHSSHSGTGSAATTVVETAQAIQKQGLAKITKVETGYPAVAGQSTARLAVSLTADWPYPDPSSYSNFAGKGTDKQTFILFHHHSFIFFYYLTADLDLRHFPPWQVRQFR